MMIPPLRWSSLLKEYEKTSPFKGRPIFDLFTKSELLDESRVTIRVGVAKVIEEAVTLADENEEGASCARVLRIALEVERQILDALGQEGDLDFGRAGVLFVLSEILDDRRGLFLG